MEEPYLRNSRIMQRPSESVFASLGAVDRIEPAWYKMPLLTRCEAPDIRATQTRQLVRTPPERGGDMPAKEQVQEQPAVTASLLKVGAMVLYHAAHSEGIPDGHRAEIAGVLAREGQLQHSLDIWAHEFAGCWRRGEIAQSLAFSRA